MEDEGRAKLIGALSGVFRRHGYAGASLAELASAAGLGKATLYHHFPGGKHEMAAAVLRAGIDELDRVAYAKLRGKGSRDARIGEFVSGFSRYVDDGAGTCLLAVLASNALPTELGAEIDRAVGTWLDQIAELFRASGQSRKRSARSARELLGRLYGALTLARMLDDPKVYRQAVKHLPV